MCGIIAIVGKSSDEEINQLLDKIQHRGQDNRGIWNDGNVWIGHNRLAIVDLSNEGNQPFVSDKWVLAFNGEIYNYQLLNNDAKNEGLMLLELLDENNNFERMLEGQYAIVAFDKVLQEVVILRDLWGICPLYYTWDEQKRLIIASEKKALYHFGKQIHEVSPAAKIRFNKFGKLSNLEQMDLFQICQKNPDINHINKLIKQAVDSRYSHTDVGINFALSGGIDSALLAVMLTDMGYGINAITVGFEGSEDIVYAEKLANEIGISHKSIILTDKIIHDIREKLLYHLEDPDITNEVKIRGAIRNFLVAKNSRSKVVFCGEGADEVFGGYPYFLNKERKTSLEWQFVTSLKSMRAINLDRLDRCGMAWTKEYRTPYLNYNLVFEVARSTGKLNPHILFEESEEKVIGKAVLKKIGKLNNVPDYILFRKKYGKEEEMLNKIIRSWSDV